MLNLFFVNFDDLCQVLCAAVADFAIVLVKNVMRRFVRGKYLSSNDRNCLATLVSTSLLNGGNQIMLQRRFCRLLLLTSFLSVSLLDAHSFSL